MSLDVNELVRAVKQASVDAVLAGKPVSVCYGTVLKEAPLEIQVDQKLILTEAQLILTNNVRDFAVEMTTMEGLSKSTGPHYTEEISHGHPVTDTYTGGGTAEQVLHRHPYTGRKKWKIHLALKTGEKVILLRCDGGQKFIVLDRWEALT